MVTIQAIRGLGQPPPGSLDTGDEPPTQNTSGRVGRLEIRDQLGVVSRDKKSSDLTSKICYCIPFGERSS